MLLRNTFKSLLQMAFVEEVAASMEEVIVIPHDITIREAILILKAGGVRAAPVMKTDPSTLVRIPVGILDFIDINKRLCELILSHQPTQSNSKELDRVADDFYNTPVHDLPGVTTEPVHCLRPGCTLLEVAQALVERHRVFVCEVSGEILQVISQRDLVETIGKLYELKLLDPHVETDTFGKVKFNLGYDRDDCKLTACNLAKKEVVLVDPSHLAMEAFLRMAEANVTKCVVVDHKGQYVWHISVKDLKHLAPEERLGALFLSSLDFVTLLRKRCVKHQHTCALYDRGDTLEKFLIKMIHGKAGRVHRVFVLDGAQRPVSVVSLRDLIGRMVVEDWFTPETVSGKEMLLALDNEPSGGSMGLLSGPNSGGNSPSYGQGSRQNSRGHL